MSDTWWYTEIWGSFPFVRWVVIEQHENPYVQPDKIVAEGWAFTRRGVTKKAWDAYERKSK